jgi:hypothetical protein
MLQNEVKYMKMKDRFWLWGQDVGRQHAASANKYKALFVNSKKNN